MISTPAVLDTCPRCGTPLLVGYSEGLLIRATATPVDPHGELDALTAGRMTYDVQPLGLPRKPYLMHRHAWRIQAARKWNVVATHKCPPEAQAPYFRPDPVPIAIPYGSPIPENPPF
ncbi:hypothetical protein GCM10017673_14700 [Streptosporangium violaceochromogenes]|nr:hypothetical protein GCM10017673_14700 [Streptosporangium violaceochromogenes]